MQVEFLGTGGFHPSEQRHTACLMVPEIGLVFDAGTSAFRVARHVQTDSLDLFLSHAHLDHICGLTYLITLPLLGEVENIRLHARSEFLDSVRDQLFSTQIFPVDPPFEFIELTEAGQKRLPSGNKIEWMKLENHPGGSTAYKVHLEDHVLAYVTDTVVDGSYRDFIQGADTLIHECYFPDAQQEWADKTGHSCATPLAELAKAAGVGRLVIVHTDPLSKADDPVGLEGMRTIFPNTSIAPDNLSLELT